MIIIAFPVRHHAVQLIHQLCLHLRTHADKKVWVPNVSVLFFIFLFYITAQCHNHLLEVSIFPLLPIHHVVENWDHNISNLGLRHQRDAEERAHHSRDEVGLVVSWITEINRDWSKLIPFRSKRRCFTWIRVC